MNLHGIDLIALTTAQGRLESWFAGMHGPEGYYGPVVGFRGVNAGYCGPGYDWRYEGLLEGWMAHAQAHVSRDTERLALLQGALAEIGRSRLGNGTLRCSYFETNPFEGGMPHEPILVASALRARALLRAANLPVDPGFDIFVERFVTERLANELWNRALRTFNNWLQSEYESYSPATVAAIIEVLLAYEEAGGGGAKLESMIKGAADSLFAAQIMMGLLTGGMPVSNRDHGPVNPALAARCLVAFDRLHHRFEDERYRHAGNALEAFLKRVALKDGGFPVMVHRNSTISSVPVFIGGTAGVLTSLFRSGRMKEEWLKPHLDFILAHQSSTGAFDTAVGFGGTAPRKGDPDWRDVLPVCGWNDKIYHLLALLNPGALAPVPVKSASRPVMVRGQKAVFEEDDRRMRLVSAGQGDDVWFDWEKRTKWPRLCRL